MRTRRGKRYPLLREYPGAISPLPLYPKSCRFLVRAGDPSRAPPGRIARSISRSSSLKTKCFLLLLLCVYSIYDTGFLALRNALEIRAHVLRVNEYGRQVL